MCAPPGTFWLGCSFRTRHSSLNGGSAISSLTLSKLSSAFWHANETRTQGVQALTVGVAGTCDKAIGTAAAAVAAVAEAPTIAAAAAAGVGNGAIMIGDQRALVAQLFGQ